MVTRSRLYRRTRSFSKEKFQKLMNFKLKISNSKICFKIWSGKMNIRIFKWFKWKERLRIYRFKTNPLKKKTLNCKSKTISLFWRCRAWKRRTTNTIEKMKIKNSKWLLSQKSCKIWRSILRLSSKIWVY